MMKKTGILKEVTPEMMESDCKDGKCTLPSDCPHFNIKCPKRKIYDNGEVSCLYKLGK